MASVTLRKLKASDLKYFSKWWRDKELIRLTSGNLKKLSDLEARRYFMSMLENEKSWQYMIQSGRKTVGHITLAARKAGWYETQIVIGEKKYWGRGIGSIAIKKLLALAGKNKISKIYLEVRPDNLRAVNTYKDCGFVAKKNKKYLNNKNLPKVLVMAWQKGRK
ncbi:MAG: GNAT family N-acetyltransferase [Candidatus Parcubacteria bacterium]|nr:GNAT family N-acetyltransferase [Candidatus Parcubacteria bacterium]